MSLTRQPTTPGSRPETAPTAATAPRPEARTTEEQVRQRAYQLFLSRQREGVPGDPITDWVRAEQELRNRPR